LQTLEEMLRTTDCLTYINALKITLTEIKDEVSVQEELRENLNSSGERVKKLVRKADNQYRLIAKLAQRHEITLASNLSIEDNSEEYKELMQQV
jgi:arsenate reductase-like glutaredoxin family protein